jgi:DNA (cytosine-5)-methyltransferase 1
VLDAQNFGVAQRRRRVFVVGCLGGWGSSSKVLFESESLSGNIAKGRSSWKETTTDAGISTQLCGPLTARDYKGISSDDCNERYMKMVATPKIANCLETTCNDYSRADGFTMIGYEWHNQDSRIKPIKIAATLNCNAGGREGHLVQKAYSVREDATVGNFHAKELDVNPCLGALWPGVQSHHTQTFISNPMAVRRLTEVECERLQGFPDNYTNIKENCPSGVRYKALGNSMAVPVMRWIGERINGYEQRGMA